MPKSPTYVKTKGERASAGRKARIYKITIDPRPNIIELSELLDAAEDLNQIEVLRMTFDCKWFTKDPKKSQIGKIRYTISDFFMDVPLQTVKFDEKYSIKDLLSDLRRLDKKLIDEYHAYTIDNLYPTAITILDKGTMKIVRFDKVRQINKESQVGKMLRGGQIMPLDAVDLHFAKLDKKTLTWVSRERPNRINEEMKMYQKGTYMINADDIKKFTHHLHPHTEKHDGQHCMFTMITTCPVLITERKMKVITIDPEEGFCEIKLPLPMEEES